MSTSNLHKFPLREYHDTANGWDYTIKAVRNEAGRIEFHWVVHVKHTIRYDLKGKKYTFQAAKRELEDAVAKEKENAK